VSVCLSTFILYLRFLIKYRKDFLCSSIPLVIFLMFMGKKITLTTSVYYTFNSEVLIFLQSSRCYSNTIKS